MCSLVDLRMRRAERWREKRERARRRRNECEFEASSNGKRK
jgi:hypothetical protein